MRWYLHGAEGSQIYWISSPVKLFTSSKWTDISIGIRQLTSSSDFYWLSGISVEKINNRRNPSWKQIFTVRNIWGIISEYFDKHYFGWLGPSSGWLLLISKSAFPCLLPGQTEWWAPAPILISCFLCQRLQGQGSPIIWRNRRARSWFLLSIHWWISNYF